MRMTRRGDHPATTRKCPPRKQNPQEGPSLFPVEGPFKTAQEVKLYLSGDKIQCLRCGKKMKMLGCHILRVHGLTCDEYRSVYGIPWGLGLVSRDVAEKMAKSVMRRMATGELPGLPPRDQIAPDQLISKRPRSLVHKNSSLANLAKANPDHFVLGEDNVFKPTGRRDKHKSTIYRKCECGVTFAVPPLARGRKVRCDQCSNARRLMLRRNRRSRAKENR